MRCTPTPLSRRQVLGAGAALVVVPAHPVCAATSQATGLGDALNRNTAHLTVTPSVGAGSVTIQVFSYSSFDLNYTLLAS